MACSSQSLFELPILAVNLVSAIKWYRYAELRQKMKFSVPVLTSVELHILNTLPDV
jgi:hypothetical protein